MAEPVAPRTRQRRAAVALAAALLCSYAYFYQGGGWNQNSRFAVDRAVLERSTLQIDAYALHTGDRALWNGHYYSDKAPGQSLLALPVVAIARVVSRAAGVVPETFPGIAWTSYAATVVTCGLFTVIAALVIMSLARRWGASDGAALFAAVGFGLASPAWAYATLFMGHALAAGLLMIEFGAAVALESSSDARRARLAWLIGASGGWAAITEYQTAIPVVLIGLLALYECRPLDRRSLLAIVPRIAGGIALAAIPFFVYSYLAFGSPVHLGYTSEEGFQELHTGFFGITTPRLSTARELLVGSYRGLFPIAPLMAVGPLGLVLLMRRRDARWPAVVALVIPLYYLLLNASYYYWEGGWAYGPRQMVTGLPFVCLGFAPLWTAGRRWGRVLLAGACAYGIAINLVAVATTPQPPSDLRAPVWELMWPAFKDGDLSLNHQTFVHGAADPALLRGNKVPHAAWNLGQLAGLRGLWSLAPLTLVWIAVGFGLSARSKS